MEKVSIIIVNWNTGSLLTKCLQSLDALPEKESVSEVLVVDNASADNSMREAQAAKFTLPVTFFALDKNIGFPRANNYAFERMQDPASHVLLLNPDTEVLPGAITAMLSTLSNNSSIGIIGPKMLEKDGATQPSVRAFPSTLVLLFVLLKLQRIFPSASFWQHYIMKDFDYTKPAEVEQVMGAAMLIRNALHESIGLLDTRFWIWFEDVDYCKQAKDAKWRIVYEPQAKVMHYGGTSFGQVVTFRRAYEFSKSIISYAFKHLGVLSGLLLMLAWPLSMVVAVFATLATLVTKPRVYKPL